MQKKIVAAGHICLDITPVFPDGQAFSNVGELFEPGKLLHMDGVDVHTGGSVANTGLALKRLGAEVQLIAKVGADAFGDIVQNIVRGYGANALLADKSCATSYTVVLAVPGCDRIFLHDPGANDSFSNADIPDEALSDAALFHFGYPPVMKRMYEKGGAELISMLSRMKRHNIATSLDLAAVDPRSEAAQVDWAFILRGALPYTDFFLPSFEEICFMLDRPHYDALCMREGGVIANLDMQRDVRPLAERLIEMGCKVVLIKCGIAGMYYKTADAKALSGVGARMGLNTSLWANQEGIQPAFQAKQVRSTTGAGDVSIAAFLLSALNGKFPGECAALAAAEGACSVNEYDAHSGIRPLEELEKNIAAGAEIF